MLGRINSTYKTSSAAIKATQGVVVAVTCIGTGAAGTITLKDGGSSGTVIWQGATPGTAGTSYHCVFPGNGLKFDTSIYLTLSNAYASVVYS